MKLTPFIATADAGNFSEAAARAPESSLIGNIHVAYLDMNPQSLTEYLSGNHLDIDLHQSSPESRAF